MSYNGWTNYETWVTKLWMDNHRPTTQFWKDVTFGIWNTAQSNTHTTRSEYARHELAETLKEECDYQVPDLPGPFMDLLNAALSEIDWIEIADSLLEEQEGYEALPVKEHS